MSTIELDGNSHYSKKQKYSDQIKNEILGAVKIKFFRVRVGEDFGEKVRDILQ